MNKDLERVIKFFLKKVDVVEAQTIDEFIDMVGVGCPHAFKLILIKDGLIDLSGATPDAIEKGYFLDLPGAWITYLGENYMWDVYHEHFNK